MKRFPGRRIGMSLAWWILLASPLCAESLNREFLAAVQAGDTAAVRRLLDEGADPSFRWTTDTVEFPETTALGEAVAEGHDDIIAAILERKPDDRVLAGAFGIFPEDEYDKSGLGLHFVETLLKQGKFPLLAQKILSLAGETPVRKILQAGQVDNAFLISKALVAWDWETVEMAAAGLRTVEPGVDSQGEAVDQSHEGLSLPSELVSRALRRPHEEEKAAELWRLFESRGLGTEKWDDLAKRAAAKARESGLPVLAEAMDPGGDGTEVAPIADEDRLASAWYYGDDLAVEKYRKAGVQLKGTARLVSYRQRQTLAAELLARKEFDRIEGSGIDLADWTDPKDDPFRFATDLETVRWLLGRKLAFDRDPELLVRTLIPLTEEKVKMTEALIEAGADVKSAGGYIKRTLLHAVVLTTDGDREEAIRMLLRKGADPNQLDGSGKSAKQQAAETYQVRMLKLLDPDRKSPFWEKYDSPLRKPYAGGWSNEASGFKIATLMLREGGDGLLNAGGVGGGLAFLRFEGEQAMLDVVSLETLVNGVITAKVTETVRVEHPAGDKQQMRLVFDEGEIELKKVTSAAELEKALNQPPLKNYGPVFGKRKAPPDDEALKNGLQRIAEGAGKDEIELSDWPLPELPEDFKSPSLLRLTLIGGKLRRLPADLATRFPRLNSLRVEQIQLEACPADLDKLSDLNQLVFDDAGLTDLPDLRLEKLMALKLRNNRLSPITSKCTTCNHFKVHHFGREFSDGMRGRVARN